MFMRAGRLGAERSEQDGARGTGGRGKAQNIGERGGSTEDKKKTDRFPLHIRHF
jgi:hypothetical protein